MQVLVTGRNSKGRNHAITKSRKGETTKGVMGTERRAPLPSLSYFRPFVSS